MDTINVKKGSDLVSIFGDTMKENSNSEYWISITSDSIIFDTNGNRYDASQKQSALLKEILLRSLYNKPFSETELQLKIPKSDKGNCNRYIARCNRLLKKRGFKDDFFIKLPHDSKPIRYWILFHQKKWENLRRAIGYAFPKV